MKCKITYDIYSPFFKQKMFRGDTPIFDEDCHKIGSKPRTQMYPHSVVIKDGDGICWLMQPNRRPVTTVPGECVLENVLLIKNPKSLVENGTFYDGDSKYLGEAQRLAELLNTNRFEVVAVNFREPEVAFHFLNHDIQIKSMTFYADNGKQLYEVPSYSFNYELRNPSEREIVDNEGTTKEVIL